MATMNTNVAEMKNSAEGLSSTKMIRGKPIKRACKIDAIARPIYLDSPYSVDTFRALNASQLAKTNANKFTIPRRETTALDVADSIFQ